jgi:hypothetical protein
LHRNTVSFNDLRSRIFLNCITGQGAAYNTCDPSHVTPSSAAYLVADHTAGKTTNDGAGTSALTFALRAENLNIGDTAILNIGRIHVRSGVGRSRIGLRRVWTHRRQAAHRLRTSGKAWQHDNGWNYGCYA